MNGWFERDIIPGFPVQGWMVVMFAIVAIWTVYSWWERR
jgi:hypothetical protein